MINGQTLKKELSSIFRLPGPPTLTLSLSLSFVVFSFFSQPACLSSVVSRLSKDAQSENSTEQKWRETNRRIYRGR